MSDNMALSMLAEQMTLEGIRRLLIISGEDSWCQEQTLALRSMLPGDWLWVGEQAPTEPCCTPWVLKTLLGREFHHAVFDARQGFDAAAFAALGDTLLSGSWLILLTPSWYSWHTHPDADSLHQSGYAEPIPTPYFVEHVKRVISRDRQVLHWQQHQPVSCPHFPAHAAWHAATDEPRSEQAMTLNHLLAMPPGVVAMTAAQGRGKSTLARQLITWINGTAIVMAPAKAATDVLAQFAGERYRFTAPDTLLSSSAVVDRLIVDEVTAIPVPLLHQLVARFPRTLLTTTVQGYEGTGRGFLLKFCARFPSLQRYELQQPVRWAQGCPLGQIVSDALVFDDETLTHAPLGELHFSALERQSWHANPALPLAVYQLLSGTHYRTSPSDLRRMTDAPGQHFLQTSTTDSVAGVIWLVDEEGLSAELNRAVWAGYRRPRDNLVAQSLAAHGGDPLAATFVGRRVSRIAVHLARQRESVG